MFKSIFQETKTPPSMTNSYHHQRAPRTPESYFNVPESVALLNIVKSERIQSAFQSNRKNHASVWEMVAEVLNRFSARKRTAKQCCNRYENLKKIYTQLKKNPERHVRRNWPYMFLFKEIEEQRGECWGSNGKRLALITKNHNELSYYQRRRQAAELGVMLNKDNLTPHQHSLLQSLSHAHSTDSSQSGASKLERFLPNQFVETQLNEGPCANGGLPVGVGVYDDNPLQLQVAGAVAAAAAAAAVAAQMRHEPRGGNSEEEPQLNHSQNHNHNHSHNHNQSHNHSHTHSHNHSHSHNAAFTEHGHEHLHEPPETPEFQKDCNGPLNLHHNSSSNNNDNNISMKSEPLSEGEFNPDEIQLMQTNYNGAQNFYSPSLDQNILHPDVIVDTDNLSDCSSAVSLKSGKRKLSTSTDGDSTNYELIEYLKRREKHDELLLKRMDAREERLMNLLERTVIAIETLAAGKLAATATSTNTNARLETATVVETPSRRSPTPSQQQLESSASPSASNVDESDSVVLVVPDDSNEQASEPMAAKPANEQQNGIELDVEPESESDSKRA
ncbi:meso18E [Drosophila busckii]|uniref:Meso18E n=1 Tax=Drosophila busckii TaxID=30019 RepID=A0A0M4FA55_DROBS|nr:stress response protein NST1 isoform X3 [Drosophila busckii]ALC49562.1 meso18E [Drosophila busckii]